MIYELRNYTMRPGRRDTLIELFEREFIEGQEAAGIGVVGQFRDLDDPNMYPWMRKFPDMEARRAALTAFYGGPIWKANRDAANATMIDSDNVLLLRPVPVPSADVPRGSALRRSGLSHGSTAGSSLDPFSGTVRPPVGATVLPESLYVAMIYHVEDGFAEFFAKEAVPVLSEAGVPPVACFETEAAENTFSALPVRTGEQVFVWFARFDRPSDERDVALPGLESRLTSPPQRLRLAPTARSALR
ncbi:NIPSNAP family protein [Nonomuraea aurantiaca]|uniref:NIPSNAP family protein n=1 Tax=Nonomuraea aurantiaca TaxID=2878562 RepID=UPI001CD9D75C|nr:NIPSNAP family protein [Nonomuraea aurantiaca]MCA2227288.1 NIPSNAP family protein [Nonomuraea aurantiaca]